LAAKITIDIKAEQIKSQQLANDLQKFKLAVENVSDQVIITDPEGMVIYVNKAIEIMTGYTVMEAIGKKAAALWKSPMPKEFYQKMWDVIKNKKQNFVGDLRNRRKNGEVYDAKISISPVLDSHGEIIFFVGIERDITKEKMIDRAKTEFVSLASHQLRTPLSTINWYTEMLLSGDAGEINKEQKEFLEAVYGGSKRMVDLVNALLNVSRIEMGALAIEPEPVDLAEVVDSVLADIQPKIIERKTQIVKKYDKLPMINLDPKLIRIVFQNLLTNAVKYTPVSGKVEMSMKKDDKEVLITVSDNGLGIPSSQQEKIFSKLFRADNARAKGAEGNGLGLYIAKSVVENCGGKIWFTSKEGSGSSFYFTIPLSGLTKRSGNRSYWQIQS